MDPDQTAPIKVHSVCSHDQKQSEFVHLKICSRGIFKTKSIGRFKVNTINVLKFRTLMACQKGLDKQARPRSDCF